VEYRQDRALSQLTFDLLLLIVLIVLCVCLGTGQVNFTSSKSRVVGGTERRRGGCVPSLVV
jgi:hypothetical protein